LAAQSFVPTSWVSPSVTLDVNIVGSANLFEAVRRAKVDSVIQIACSSEEYGMVYENELPIRETNPLRPLSPYAVSKVAMDYLGYQYHESYGIKIIRTRDLTIQVPEEAILLQNRILQNKLHSSKRKERTYYSCRNLDARRDYTDVRDMVRDIY
jgi:GDP-4-dehydro-6-deoxy-D-mannose reductase